MLGHVDAVIKKVKCGWACDPEVNLDKLSREEVMTQLLRLKGWMPGRKWAVGADLGVSDAADPAWVAFKWMTNSLYWKFI